VFDDLEPGDYLFEIAEPSDKGWIMEFVDNLPGSDDEKDPSCKLEAINWRLRVIQPEEMEGRNFFHSTWIAGTPDKIAKAKRQWDPASFTYQFLADIGVAMIERGEATILDDYLNEDGWFLPFGWEGEDFVCDTDNLNKTIGVRFWGSIRMKKRGKAVDAQEYPELTKAWQDK